MDLTKSERQFYRNPRGPSNLPGFHSEGFQAEKSAKIVGKENSEVGFSLPQHVCQTTDDLGQVGRMIEGLAFVVAEEVLLVPVRGEHVWSIGFDEETIGRNLPEGGANLFLVLPEKIARKGESGAKGGEGGDELARAAVGMQKKATGGAFAGAEDLHERAPGLETVDREWQVVFRREIELEREYLPLFLEMRFFHPSVKAAFTEEDCSGVLGEGALQFFQPVRTAAFDLPGVKAQGGLHQIGIPSGQ